MSLTKTIPAAKRGRPSKKATTVRDGRGKVRFTIVRGAKPAKGKKRD